MVKRTSSKFVGASVLALLLAFSGYGDWQSEFRRFAERGRFSPRVARGADFAVGVNLDKKQAFKVIDAYADLLFDAFKLSGKIDDAEIAEARGQLASFKEDPFRKAPEGMRQFLKKSGLRDVELRWGVLSLEGFEIVDDKPRLGGFSLAVAGTIDLNRIISVLRQEVDGDAVFEETRLEGETAWHIVPQDPRTFRKMRDAHVDLHVTSLDGQLVLFATSRETLARQIRLYRTGWGRGDTLGSFSAAEGELMHLHLSGIGGLARKCVPRTDLRKVTQIVPNGDELLLGLENLDVDLNVLPDGTLRDSVRLGTASEADADSLRTLAKTGMMFWRTQLSRDPTLANLVKQFFGEIHVGGTGRELRIQGGLCTGTFVAGALFPVVSSAMLNAMSIQGRKLIMGIVQANIDRQGKADPVWPRTKLAVAADDTGDVAGKVYGSSTEYFRALFDMTSGRYGTTTWNPAVDGELLSALWGFGVPGMTGTRLESRNVAWTIAANVRDETPDFIPVLITANFNPSLLVAKWDGITDGEKVLPLGPVSGAAATPFGDKAVVIVRKSGAAERIKAKDLTYNRLYLKQPFDLTNMESPLTYLTPTGSTELKLPQATKSAKRRKFARPRPVIDMLPATSVVVRVNGEDITKGDFATLERDYVKMFEMANANRKWSPATAKAEKKKFKHNNRVKVLDDLITLTLINQYARAEGIEADAAGIAAKEREILKMLHKPNAKFADVAASFGPGGGEMLKRVMIEGAAVTMAALVRSTTNDLYHVTDQEIMNRLMYVEKMNRAADASNAVVRARAMQAKKEILAGAIFADVAKKYADFSPEQGAEWETVELSDYDGDNPLGQWLARSDTGDISDPLVLDDGVSIVGIKAKCKSELSESNKLPVYVYDIVRCAFHDYAKLDDFDGDRKSIEEDMIQLRRQAAMQALMAKLKEKAKFEFPSGHNLFYSPVKKQVKKAGAKKPATETR